METIFSDGKTLEIERKLKCTVFLPQLCYFCKEEIMEFGRVSGSLCFHSLDSDHDNWKPSNKVPAHRGCHARFHTQDENTGLKKIWEDRRARYGPSGYKDPEAHSRIMSESMSGEDGAAKQIWAKRRERYGPSGFKNPGQVWKTRRERYGPTGRKPK